MDRNPREVAKLPIQRFHRGALGGVLERYLQNLHRRGPGDYSMVALEQLLAEAAQHDPAIGLHLFAQFTPQDRHLLFHASGYCADIDAALRFWIRYGRLASDMDCLRYVEAQGGAGVEVSIDAPEALARFTVEHYFVMCLSAVREACGRPLQPEQIRFAHPRPAYHARYREIFGEQVSFGCASNFLGFTEADLRLPLLSRHAGMLDVISQELERRLARQQQLSGWAGKVAQGVRRALDEGRVPSLEEQAATLHQSARTLRRRLEEQGLSFRQLLDLVRAELEQHLELQGRERGEIAARLGYSDLDAYQHARKRWREG